jgi:predicted nucleic acid-binding protein
MPDIIISDTSCLILLDKIGHLELLEKVYQKVRITPEILGEFGKSVPDWITVEKPTNTSIQQVLEQNLDTGEASAIALAYQFPESTLIIDDLKARKAAKDLNFKVTGTLGVIVKAKQMGVIKKIKPVIDKLIQTDFRISQNVIEEILKRAGE